MILLALVFGVLGIGSFFGGAIGPGIGFMILSWVCAAISEG